ncbi:MAG: carboxylate-amine ligase [Ignavibacteria bacterium RIFOXYB2_FULL_35_12]|nr:MAG: carboxylate-amine ligase [Ignavibacteria bacterium GWA2_36_19]OGU51030.1 MAG: carboxylate-amine ligase [Ignavibacteria bacterium GWC2_35_8]OGU62322.1 MAG: carboxylate-amine ligase [Ignavibacteria bacterium GWF2_35_20]OGU79182.1 MAG: carboxylate-amine ligase [Ignavibacteria bacterium RIFOXYA2_FULL_35_9]OGU86195.1 MAG: carboxylate-amine ligase [Ignavibacteria bacterium RIFOXYA12_FULL_35_25]OGU90857.1 MAG: carboxylate-amine ligase [Ignavibacteria bacterium RIFOXYC12_FULL_35_11]OGU92943.1
MEEKKLFTLGIEEEFQIVDPESRELKSHIQQILEDGKLILAENVKAEMHQSVVEMGTDVCYDINDARRQVTRLRRDLSGLAKKNNLRIAAAGTHPFSHWKDQKITVHPRYKNIVSDMQQVARANLIFGLHIHVGVNDREVAIHIMNAARYFLPHIFALSTNSPFWLGRNTGFKSYRSKVFDRFPRTGIPDYFSSVSEYDNYIKLLVKTNCIDNAKKIWWDIRVHPTFETLEFRICDVPMRIDETIALAALCQAVVAKLHRLIKQNLGFRLYRRALIAENKWRASRYGISGKLIDFGKQEEVDTKALIEELLEFVDDVADELNSRHELEYIKKICEYGTGADRQLEIWEQSYDTKAVVDYIIDETHIGLDEKSGSSTN